MSLEFLHYRILRVLRDGPQSVSNLAVSLSVDVKTIRKALGELTEEGRVNLAMDGRSYELSSGGCHPAGPGGLVA